MWRSQRRLEEPQSGAKQIKASADTKNVADAVLVSLPNKQQPFIGLQLLMVVLLSGAGFHRSDSNLLRLCPELKKAHFGSAYGIEHESQHCCTVIVPQLPYGAICNSGK